MGDVVAGIVLVDSYPPHNGTSVERRVMEQMQLPLDRGEMNEAIVADAGKSKGRGSRGWPEDYARGTEAFLINDHRHLCVFQPEKQGSSGIQAC